MESSAVSPSPASARCRSAALGRHKPLQRQFNLPFFFTMFPIILLKSGVCDLVLRVVMYYFYIRFIGTYVSFVSVLKGHFKLSDTVGEISKLDYAIKHFCKAHRSQRAFKNVI